MSKFSDLYRSNAAQQQALAAKALLPNVRALHERAVVRWLELADQADAPGDRTGPR